MPDIEFTKMFAKAYVEDALDAYARGNDMVFIALLSGINSWKLEHFPGGNHMYNLIIDAMHELHKEDSSLELDIRFKEALNKMLQVSKAKQGLGILMNVIIYEAKKEKEGTNSFCIGLDEVLDKLNNLITDNYDAYKREDLGFDLWLERKISYARDKYGIEILRSHVKQENPRQILRKYVGGGLDFDLLSDDVIEKLYENYQKATSQIEFFIGVIEVKVKSANQRYSEGDKGNFIKLLLGREEGFVEMFDGAGHCYPVILEVIHNLYSNDRNCQIDVNYAKCLLEAVEQADTEYEITLMKNIISYEENLEKDDSHSFKLDINKMTDRINSKLH
ncbi:hypothetical protein [Butyrivibrio sp. XBB1001]|uniref:hypothetical protein n=1 Tax=Butyrivibrio sp. XBB1001 TaxID=1280682 RepID=UPI000427C0E5|nr:hypothetical protein [Butyrivibrio sp. XBB1001]